MASDVRIEHEMDHYVVYVDGRFYCTADTYSEALQTLQQDGLVG